MARAQAYPSRSVRIVVGFPPGQAIDIVGRVIADWFQKRLGQPFVVENRPGAGGNSATEAVVRASGDGYTLILVTPSHAINATLYEKLNFNFIRDIAPVAGILRVPYVMEVNPSVPVKTVSEFIGYAKDNPGKLKMASAGNGTPGHLAGELFRMMTGLKMVHVPYRGSAPMLIELISGQVQVTFDNMPPSIQHARAGKLRALAVTTAARSPALPDVPVVAEFVPGYEASAWFGIGVPKGTPAAIIERLNREINSGLADPKVRDKLVDLGGMLMGGTPADFGKVVVAETEKWAKVVKFSGAKAE